MTKAININIYSVPKKTKNLFSKILTINNIMLITLGDFPMNIRNLIILLQYKNAVNQC